LIFFILFMCSLNGLFTSISDERKFVLRCDLHLSHLFNVFKKHFSFFEHSLAS